MSTHGFVQRGRELFERGDFQEAVKVCRRGLLAHPTAVDGRLLLGLALMSLRRYGEVVAEMAVVLDGDARHPQALALKGEALLHKGDAGRALQALKQAQEVSPADPAVSALLRQAESLVAEGNFDFSDDDPNSSVTRHYPLNQLQGMVPKGGGDPVPPASPGRRSEGGTENESGSMEIYLEPGDVDLIDNLLDGPGGSSGASRDAEAIRTRKMRPANQRQTGSREAALEPPAGRASATIDELGEIEEIADDLVEEIQSTPSMTNVLDSFGSTSRAAAADATADDQPPVTSRLSSFDTPTVIYRSAEGKGEAQGADDPEATVAQRPPRAGDSASVQTDHFPQLSSPGSAAGGGQLPPSQLPPSQLAGDVLGDLDDEDDDEPPTQMIPLDSSWEGSGQEPGDTRSYSASSSEPTASSPGAPGAPAMQERPSTLQGHGSSGAIRSAAAPSGAGGESGLMRPQLPPDSAQSFHAVAQPTLRGMTPATGKASGKSRPAAGAQGRTAFVRRQNPPGRRRSLYYIIAALAVVAGGAVAGLQIRKVRLEWEITQARTQAAEHVQRDTYAGYVRARRAYTDILDVDEDLETRAALARVQAALAAEFGVDLDAARTAVHGLEDARQLDAAVARTYLALAEGDPAAARDHVQEIDTLAPDDPFGPYLAGCASLLAGAGADAASAFGRALEMGQRPLFHVGLGRAHLAGGALAEAEAAFRGALEQVPGYPAAVLGLAQVAVAGNGEVPEQLSGDLQGLIEEALRPVDEQSVGVSSAQAARAALALGSLRLLQGDEDGAREAVSRARATAEGDPGLAQGLALDLAGVLERLGDSEAALAEARRAVEAFPGRLDARMTLARLALEVGDPESAMRALEDAGETVSRNALALALRARARLARGDMDTAADELEAALALESDQPVAVIARAEIDLRWGKAEAAVERLAPMVGPEAKPGAPADARVVYAEALRQIGRLKEARQVIEELLAGPEAGRGYLELARLERKQGNIDQARAAYASAAERMGGVEARLEAALLAFDTGDREGGRQRIAELAERAGDNGRVLLEAARLHSLSGRLDEAARYLEQAESLESAPRGPLARERGRLALRRRDPEAAIEALEQAKGLLERDAETYLLLIEAHLAARDNDAAAGVRDQVLARFDDSAPVRHLAVGRLASISTEPEQAIRTYRQARSLLEKQGALLRELAFVDYLMARAYYYMDNLREAESVLSKLLKRDPAYADAYYVLGLVQYTREQPESAIDAFQKVIDLDSASHPDALFYLGEVNYQNDRAQAAGKAFRAYLDQAPDGEHAGEAKAYLEEL